jgi:phenylalanyl-tRNA synthetase alpha chain
MLTKIDKLINDVKAFKATSKDEIEAFRIKYLGSKGLLKELFNEFKQVDASLKKDIGQALNNLRNSASDKVNILKENLDNNTKQESLFGDLTRPSEPLELGSRHPISIVKNRIIEIFSRIGFNVSEGPEIEDDWHNFTALNLPEHHPARDMQDTFFIEQSQNSDDEDILLRTHTSSVQVRYMENNKPPIRTISPGRVFRNEDISARAHCIFHQVEGLYIDKDVSFADLKQTLLYFTKEMFGKSKIRLRPSYFPFTEPSAEVDIYWGLETEVDYKITKGTGWLEIMGCGMVDPNVLKNANIDPKEYSGFAFGMGIERIAMLLYQIPDIRLFYENDIRFLKQFKSVI